MSAAASASGTAGGLRLVERGPHCVEIAHAGGPLATYHWPQHASHPYFHPLCHRASSGSLTNHAPFDHPWHAGHWWSWKKINGVVFWENNHPDEQGRYHVAAHRHFTDGPRAVIEQDLELRPPTGEAWLTERRVLTAHGAAPGADLPGGWALDWSLQWTARVDCTLDVTPKVTEQRWGGYGGLNVRPARALAWDEQIITSEGGRGGEHDLKQMGSAHTTAARWAAYAGRVDGEYDFPAGHAGVAVLDYPANPRHPTPWYLWSAGPGMNGFGFIATAPTMHEPLVLARGATLALRYRVVPFRGLPDVAALESAWQAFAAS